MKSRLLVVLASCALFLAGCGGASSPAPAAPAPSAAPAAAPTAAQSSAQTFAGPIKIGIVGPFSGPSAQAGERIAAAVKMAIEEQNAAGGLLGAKIEAVVSDDEATPEKSTTVAQRLVDDLQVVAVIGPMNSGPALAAGPIYEKGSLTFITPTGTNPKITESGWKVAHRLAGRDDREGPASAQFIADQLKPKKVLLIDDKTAFQAGIVKEVQRVLNQKGITDTTLEELSDQDKDFSPLLTKIKSTNYDLVYIGFTGSQAALLLKQAAQQGVKFTGFGNGSLHERDTFIKAAAGEAEGTYVSYNAQDPKLVPEAKEFTAKFESKYGFAVSAYEPQAYDAVHMLFNAIKAAGVKDGKINRADVLSQLKAIKDYKGVLGVPITFDSKGDIAAAPVNIFQVKNNDFTFIKAVVPQ